MLSPEQANFLRWVLRFHYRYVRPSRKAIEEEIEARASNVANDNTPVQGGQSTPISQRIQQAKERNAYLQTLIEHEDRVNLGLSALLESDNAPISNRLIEMRYRDGWTVDEACAHLGMSTGAACRAEMQALATMAPLILGGVWGVVK